MPRPCRLFEALEQQAAEIRRGGGTRAIERQHGRGKYVYAGGAVYDGEWHGNKYSVTLDHSGGVRLGAGRPSG